MKRLQLFALGVMLMVLGFAFKADAKQGVALTMGVGLVATMKTKGINLSEDQEKFINELDASIDIKNANSFADIQKQVDEYKEQIKGAQVKADEADKRAKDLDKALGEFKKNGTPSQGTKSIGQVIGDALDKEGDNLAKLGRKEIKSVSLDIDLKAVGDMSTGNVTGGSRYGQIMQPGIIELPKRKVHMRQVLPGGGIGPGNTLSFMKQNGNGEGGITPVAEGATKPQLDLDLVEASVSIETLAGWLRITNKALNNIPGIISFLQSRLPEALYKVEDSNILYGDGTSPNLKGILTSGNFVASTSSATALAEKIIDDIAALEDTYERNATLILMRPVNYYGFFKNKASGSGEYDLPQNVVFANGTLYISGIPVYATTALGQSDVGSGVMKNNYVVGDFNMGAQLLTQEAAKIEFFREDGTNVRENKVTVRIEETIALPVYGSNYFIKGNEA